MSLVVAVARGGRIHVGADSGSFAGTLVYPGALPKVWRLGRAVIGFCGLVAARDALLMAADLPEPEAGEDPVRYAIRRLGPAIRQAAADFAPGFEEQGRPPVGGLVALDGYLFEMSGGVPEVALARGADGFAAEGKPSVFAHGALAALLAVAPDVSPEEACRTVLALAAEHTDACRPPFVVLAT